MTEDDVTQRLDGRHNNDKVKDILMVRQKTLKNNFFDVNDARLCIMCTKLMMNMRIMWLL